MIAFDLKCSGGHVFEGWFRSSADFEIQATAAMIPCPMCGASDVTKAVMAPNIARKANQLVPQRPPTSATPTPESSSAPLITAPALPAPLAAMAAALAAAQAEALPKSTWVGDQFAARARAMHDGAEDQALIHGQATREDAEALVDDGIAIMPLLVPVIPPELQN